MEINTEESEYQLRIKKETEKFFEMMTFRPNLIDVVRKGDIYLIETDISNPKTLIGERGRTLSEIQYMLRLLVRKIIQSNIFIELDINDYKKKKRKILGEIAKEIGDEVILHKKERVLPPMSPYERRIVHLALKERVGIQTKSIGEGINRKVVIKPV